MLKPAVQVAQSMPENSIKTLLQDMNGVVARIVKMQAAIWKRMYNNYLLLRTAHEYWQYIDGMPRYDGVGITSQTRQI